MERMFEVRSINSISMNLKERFEGWSEHMTGASKKPLGVGAELTIAQSRLSLKKKKAFSIPGGADP